MSQKPPIHVPKTKSLLSPHISFENPALFSLLNSPLINKTYLSQIMKLDEGDGFFASLVESFLLESSSWIDSIFLFDNPDLCDDLYHLVYQLKGISTQMGACELAKQCQSLEKIYGNKQMPSAQQRKSIWQTYQQTSIIFRKLLNAINIPPKECLSS